MHTSGNPVLCTEIVGPHRPNWANTQNSESWVGGEDPPGLTIVKPGQDVRKLSVMNCESSPPPPGSSNVKHSHLIMLWPTFNSLMV